MLADVSPSIQPRAGFAPTHPAEGRLFVGYMALIWIGMIWGFGGEIARHIRNGDPPYPMIHNRISRKRLKQRVDPVPKIAAH